MVGVVRIERLGGIPYIASPLPTNTPGLFPSSLGALF
jgi:hypothetical protein